MQIILTRTVSQTFGVTFVRRGSQIEVAGVAHLSIAHLADLRVGDILTRINGSSCANLAVASIDQIMSGNPQVVLEVTRTSAPSQQTPQSATTNRMSIPSGSQVIELDSGDDEDTIHYGFSDENSELSDDDDDDAFELRRTQLLNRLQTSAQRMQTAAPPATAPAVRRPVIPYNRGEVVDLLSDDDDVPPARPEAPVAVAPRPAQPATRPPTAPARSQTQPAATSTAGVAAARTPAPSTSGLSTLARAATVSTPASATSTTVSGGKRTLETSPTPEPAKKRKITVNGVEIKLEFEPKKFGEANITDEVVEVLGEEEEAAPASAAKANAEVEMVVAPGGPAKSTDEDSDFEDFQIVGGTMQVASDMPHQRYACTMHPFRMAPAQYNSVGQRQNETANAYAERCRMNLKHCAKCYCYVCDMVVTECGEWAQHCHATHKEPRWKQEKDSRNSKILSLMTAQNRAAFFQRYKDALTNTVRTSMATGYDSDDDYVADYARVSAGTAAFGGADFGGYGHYGGSQSVPSGNPKDLTNTANLLTLVQAKLLKSKQLSAGNGTLSGVSTLSLKPSSSSGALSDAASSPRSGNSATTDKEVFLEASELLMRAITSPRHAGDAPMMIARAFVTWFMNPLCSLDLRTILRNEMTAAQARSMVLTSAIYQGLKELVLLDNASVLKLRQRNSNVESSTAAGAVTAALPPQLLGISEQVQGLLVPELLELGNFAAIKHLVSLRPSLVPSLLLYHIRNGSTESCREGVSLVYQYCAQRNFTTLRGSIQDIELPKLFKFLAAVLAHNMAATASTAPSSQAQLRQLHDSVTDVLFNILLTKIYETIKVEHAAVIATSIDAYIAREGSVSNPIRLDNVLTWIEAETAQTYNYSPLVVVLYLKYSNWRVNFATYAATASFSVIPPLIITPAVYGNLRFPLLVVLANAFCKYFQVSPQALDTADINAGVHLACHIAARSFQLLNNANKVTDFDPAIREAWATLPDLRKASPGEMCSAHGSLKAHSYCVVCAADNHTELRICPTQTFTSKNALNRPAVASWSAVLDSEAPMRVTATYCDVHHTYDTFLMSIVVPKNPVETRTAFACWGHQLQIHELVSLLSQMEVPAHQVDASLAGYVSFLALHREVLFILWKGLLRQMYAYMHAMYHVETTSMASLLSQLARIVKPWLSELEVVSVNQFSAHASCRGYSQTQLLDMQALDLNLRVVYQFSKFISKLQQTANGAPLTLSDVRNFKSSIPRFETLSAQQALSAKMCRLYLLEFPSVSTRAIWHSFWRRFLLCLVSKRQYHGGSDAQAVEDLAISLQLEDWAQVKEIITKAPATPRLVRNFISALALLQASDVTAMNYGGVSGSQVLRGELERVLRIKYTVPVLQENPLTHMSDKCLECPDSALAHLVLQLPPDLLQYGALDYQPFFTYALQKKVDASATSILATSDSLTALQSCYKLVMRAHEDCVAIFSTPGRNMSISYTKVLCGLASLRRYDLVRVLVAAGYESLAVKQHNLGEGRLKLVIDTLMMAHSRADFEQLLEVLDRFISEAYLESSAFASMAPVIRKFCPLADLQITTSQSSTSSAGASDSARIKLLRFYHAYDAPSFLDYWRSAARTETEKAHILGWMKRVQGSPRFRTAVHLSVLSQLLDPAAFGAYLNGPELESPSIDKLVVFNTLLQLIPSSPAMVALLVTATVRILLSMACLSDSMRASLTACCTDATLPVAPAGSQPGYADARTLLLFVANPQGAAHVDALANVYTVRTPKEKENMCKVLFSKDKPSALIKLLLRVRDYKQLFATLKDAYYTSVVHTEHPSIHGVAMAVHELRQSLTMNNLYNDSAAGNASISAFQKQLFDEGSFTVGLARFLLVLNEHHIDDRTVALPEPLNGVVQELLETIRGLVHGDPVVVSYLHMHTKFTTATVLQFFNDCAAANYATVPFTPMAHTKTKPSTLCVDTLTFIAKAPKFYTVALSYITVLNFVVSTLTQNILRAGPGTKTLLGHLVNSPCWYRRDSKQKNSLAKKGLLWIPKHDSGTAVPTATAELTKLLQSFGADFAEILEESILTRLYAGEVAHRFDNAAAAPPVESTGKITLKEWYANHSDTLLRVVEQMRPATSYSYLLDIMGLYINFNYATFTKNLHQALSRPPQYVLLYRKIILNLLLHAITVKAMDLKVVLRVLCHEFHHPDNHFGLYFTEHELGLVMDCLQSTDDLRDRARQAIMARDGTAQLPLNSLLKIPRILQLIAKDFTKELSYDSFGALHHAAFFLTMWRELATTPQKDIAFEQANDCFKAIATNFRSNTVQARLRTIFEGMLPHYKQFLDMYPERAAEVKTLKTELRQIVKSKPALVKALAVLN